MLKVCTNTSFYTISPNGVKMYTVHYAVKCVYNTSHSRRVRVCDCVSKHYNLRSLFGLSLNLKILSFFSILRRAREVFFKFRFQNEDTLFV